MARLPEQRIARGIFRDANGFTARVKARGVEREQRFSLGTSLRTITDWRDRERGRLKEDLPPATRGTLARDVVRYLATLPDTIAGDEEGTRRARELRRERQHQLDWWIAQFPAKQKRSGMDPLTIRARLHDLRAVRSASTCNHYREALYQLYQTLDGPDARNPVRSVPRFEEPDPEPREIPRRLVLRIFEALPDLRRSVKGERRTRTPSLTKIRLRVMYETGLSPAEMMRIQPRDLHLADAALYVRRRRKGKGVQGATIPLTVAGVTALRAFVAAGAFGRFSTRGASQSFNRAVKQVAKAEDVSPTDRALLTDARPYDFRHCFASKTLRDTNDLKTTQELMRHRSTKTTKRYAHAAIPEHLRRAVDRLDAAASGENPATATGSD